MKIKLSVGAVVLSGFFQVGVCAASVTSVVPKVAKNVLPIGADSAQKLVSTAKTGLLDLVNNFKTKGAEQQPLPNPEPSTLVKAKNSALAYISKPRVESGWLKVHVVSTIALIFCCTCFITLSQSPAVGWRKRCAVGYHGESVRFCNHRHSAACGNKIHAPHSPLVLLPLTTVHTQRAAPAA